MDKERIEVKVVDEGGGCYSLETPTAGAATRLKEILGSPCGVRVRVEEFSEVAEEAAEVGPPAEAEPVAIGEPGTEPASELADEGPECPLEPGVPWRESVCGELEDLLAEKLVERVATSILEREAEEGGSRW